MQEHGQTAKKAEAVRSYHDLYITTKEIKRTSIFNLPFNIQVICTRVGGWEVWNTHASTDLNMWELLGGEYENKKPLRLDVKEEIIVDSFWEPK
jgi:hypothetical protein